MSPVIDLAAEHVKPRRAKANLAATTCRRLPASHRIEALDPYTGVHPVTVKLSLLLNCVSLGLGVWTPWFKIWPYRMPVEPPTLGLEIEP